jgi:spore cortex biosynthesis protein YabQ
MIPGRRMEKIDWQLSTIVLLMLAGTGWGFLADCFRVLKKGRRNQVLDFFFWPVSLFFLAPVIFYANWGEIRLYVWLSLGVGVIIYRKLFRRAVMLLLQKE